MLGQSIAWPLAVWVACLLGIRHQTQAASYEDVLAVKSSIFSGYDKTIRPFTDFYSPTVVYIGLQLVLDHTGFVEWLLPSVFKTTCDIDVTYYPFDTQRCDIVVSVLVSHIYHLVLQPEPDMATSLNTFKESGTWQVVSFTVSDVSISDMKSTLTVTLELKRKTTYYLIAILVPVLFLSLTATLVFALPADSGEKMGTSITVLLAFAVYLTIVSEQMPKTSNSTSLLSVYLSVVMGQTALGVVLSVWILNLHFRDDERSPPGPRLRTLAVYLQRLMCKRPWKPQVVPADCPVDDSSLTSPVSTVTTPIAPLDTTSGPEDSCPAKFNTRKAWPSSSEKESLSSKDKPTRFSESEVTSSEPEELNEIEQS
ncbi:acetylcholine receptor subunit delta-like [Babylonia areolata]|uniref:acetylcholine receptor subunit delta-like n=1 Tax=Babylonia areolata TaxID=304850 RepID=UPI003FD2BE0A